jgi:multiple sugar transport system substrate-binding protein
MKESKRITVLIIAALVVLFAASCRLAQTPTATAPPQTETEVEPAEEQVEEPTEKPPPEMTAPPEPTETPEPTPPPPDYDVEIYGYLENLDPGGQIVTLWHQQSGDEEALILNFIDQFNQGNEWGVTVRGERQGDRDALYNQIIAGIQGEQLPSVAEAYQNQAADYVAQNGLLALRPYVESARWGYSEEALDDFFSTALNADILPQFGARYGWSTYKSMDVMYYNEDWLSELGYIGPPRTWREFAEMTCAAAEQPFSGASGEGQSYGYVHAIDARRFATWLFSSDGDMVNQNGGGYIFNSPEGYEVLTFLKHLTEQGCAAGQTEPYGDRRDFSAGRSLFTIASISDLSDYERAVNDGAGFNWRINPPPHVTPHPRIHVYGVSNVIFRSTPEEQLASWLFIKWLSEPAQQQAWVARAGGLPTRASTAASLSDYFAGRPAYEEIIDFMSLDYGARADVTGYEKCRPNIEEMLTAILGSADAQGHLDVTVERCNEHLRESAP